MSNTSKFRYKPPKKVQDLEEFVFEDGYLEGNCPCLYDLLSRQLSDGKKVKPCSMSFFAQEGKLTCCLNWDEQGLMLFCAVQSTETCFDDVEAKLVKTEPGWRKKKERRYTS